MLQFFTIAVSPSTPQIVFEFLEFCDQINFALKWLILRIYAVPLKKLQFSNTIRYKLDFSIIGKKYSSLSALEVSWRSHENWIFAIKSLTLKWPILRTATLCFAKSSFSIENTWILRFENIIFQTFRVSDLLPWTVHPFKLLRNFAQTQQ